MINPKCGKCLKIIPDSFIDCPWCGAKQLAPAPPKTIAEDELSQTRKAAYGLLSLVSFCLVIYSNYLIIEMTEHDVYPQYSPHFIGRCVGSFLVPALGIFLYYKLRHQTPSDLKKVLLICTWALLPSVLGLAGAMQGNIPGADSRKAPEDSGVHPANASATEALGKWGPAAARFGSDMRTFNEQYVSEVSKTDSDAPQLLSITSFRDAATMEKELTRLQGRLEINAKYRSLDPVLDKMKGYLDTVDASPEDKTKVLDGFNSAAQKFVTQRNVVMDLERQWLLTSTEVYGFALKHKSEYAFQDNNLVFRSRQMLQAFNNKLLKARTQYSNFLRSYGELRRDQDATLAQMSGQRSDTPNEK
jgi:hypothetical protein